MSAGKSREMLAESREMLATEDGINVAPAGDAHVAVFLVDGAPGQRITRRQARRLAKRLLEIVGE